MMMQQTMETNHTGSIQGWSWNRGLKQVNPSNGHIKYFLFFYYLFLKQGFCFSGTKQAPFGKATQNSLKNQ